MSNEEQQIKKFREEYLKFRKTVNFGEDFHGSSMFVSGMLDTIAKELVQLALIQTKADQKATLQTLRENVNNLFSVAVEALTDNTRTYGELVTEQLVTLANKSRQDLN